MEVLKRAIALSPGVPEAHYELGKAYLASSRLDAASKEFKLTIQLAPQFASAYYQLARIYKQRGETQKVRQMAERTTQLRQAQYAAALKAHDSLLNHLQQQPTH